MVLKRLTITGFKSFANKTVLDFEPGMTAIVGPNGSGKSNVADAIRWVMGEQSKGKLRLKDRDEVVFGGSEKRARASFAEVVMLFDNTSGIFPLDMTEVELSRRLYRSGESDYRLNGKPVRFSEVSALLAESGFGRDSYAVVGQGMIDTLLISSPVERKLMFEEAAGIRGFEIKRAEAVKRLNATAANLVRLQDIRHELEPRLDQLKAALAVSQRRDNLQHEVNGLRQRLVDAEVHHIATRTEALGQQQASLIAKLSLTVSTCQALEAEIATIRQTTAAERSAQTTALTALAQLEEQRDKLAVSSAERQIKLAELQSEAALAATAEKRRDQLESEVLACQSKIAEHEHELSGNITASTRAEAAVAEVAAEIKAAEVLLRELRARTADGSQRQYVEHALGLVKTMAQQLSTNERPVLEDLRLLVHKTGRLLSYASKSGEMDVLEELRQSQTGLESLMRRRETALEHQANILLSRRSIELDLTHLRERQSRLTLEIKHLTDQVKQHGLSARHEALKAAEVAAANQLKAVIHDLNEHRKALSVRSDSDTSENLASKVAELEQSRARVRTLQDEESGLRAQSRQLEAANAMLATHLADWELTASPRRGDCEEITRLLESTQSRLAAESQYAAQVESDYSTTSQRDTELLVQLNDLEAAQRNIHEVLTHLDKSIRERFDQNFQGIAKHFDRAFSRLFDGGSASLQLTREEDGDYGINIKVNPKGKRLSSLEVLSGGERTLAGVALLTAILEVNPSPFIVLDEVDAALDEANSGRLAQILRELAVKSQLIVITHNRQTMEAAKVLFGVSMNDHHFSHLLSLHLEDATLLAAR